VSLNIHCTWTVRKTGVCSLKAKIIWVQVFLGLSVWTKKTSIPTCSFRQVALQIFTCTGLSNFLCDPNVVFKCSHHKDAKNLERECKHEHCLNHIFFLAAALLSVMHRCLSYEGSDLMIWGLSGITVSGLSVIQRCLNYEVASKDRLPLLYLYLAGYSP